MSDMFTVKYGTDPSVMTYGNGEYVSTIFTIGRKQYGFDCCHGRVVHMQTPERGGMENLRTEVLNHAACCISYSMTNDPMVGAELVRSISIGLGQKEAMWACWQSIGGEYENMMRRFEQLVPMAHDPITSMRMIAKGRSLVASVASIHNIRMGN